MIELGPTLLRRAKDGLGLLVSRVDRARGGFRTMVRDRLRFTKGVLVVILLCLAGIFVYDLTLAPALEIASLGAEATGSGMEPQAGQAAKPLSFYTNAIGRRDLFRATDIAATAGPAPAGTEDEIKKSLEKLELLGILLDDKPQAVIEDKETEKTYFLYEGDTIRGAVVEKILKGKIVLKHSGRTFELVL